MGKIDKPRGFDSIKTIIGEFWLHSYELKPRVLHGVFERLLGPL